MTKVGAEQNVFTDCARRKRSISALDGGSIPPSSTSRCHAETMKAGSLGVRPSSCLVKAGAELRPILTLMHDGDHFDDLCFVMDAVPDEIREDLQRRASRIAV